MPIIMALLRFIPGMSGLLLRLTTWLTRSRWGFALSFFLVSSIWQIIERLLFFIGLSWVATEYAAPEILPMISGPLMGLPPEWTQLMALTKVDQAITILVSAVVTRAISSIRLQRNPQAPGWSTSPGAGAS